MWYIYTVEYYIAVMNNAIMQFVTIWMKLKDIMLNEARKIKINTE